MILSLTNRIGDNSPVSVTQTKTSQTAYCTAAPGRKNPRLPTENPGQPKLAFVRPIRSPNRFANRIAKAFHRSNCEFVTNIEQNNKNKNSPRIRYTETESILAQAGPAVLANLSRAR